MVNAAEENVEAQTIRIYHFDACVLQLNFRCFSLTGQLIRFWS
jgi:hypothetical protein